MEKEKVCQDLLNNLFNYSNTEKEDNLNSSMPTNYTTTDCAKVLLI